MTEEEFIQLAEALQNGDNTVLQRLQPYQTYCQKTVMIKSHQQCSAEESYDIFVDAILDFRRNVLAGKVEYKAIRAYLARICFNKWMERSRNKRRNEIHLAELAQVTDQMDGTSDPETLLVQQEEIKARATQQQIEIAQIEAGMAALSEKCRKILMLAIVDEVPMARIAELLGFANRHVAKTTKSRCYQQLVNHVSNLQK